MNTQQKGPLPPASITLRDVYYVLFRHKWLTLVLLTLGVAAGAGVYLLWPFPYISEAKINIRYVADITGESELKGSARVVAPNEQGISILNTELLMLTSRDLTIEAATNVGPLRILRKSTRTNDVLAAAAVIGKGMRAEVEKDSDVLFLQFSSEDPGLPQQVVSALVSAYIEKSKAVHYLAGFSTHYLELKLDDSKTGLDNANQMLEEVKTKWGITSVEEARKGAAALIAATKQQINQTELESAETTTYINYLKARIAAVKSDASVTNNATNAAAADQLPPPSPDVVAKYQSLMANLNERLNEEERRDREFQPDSPAVQRAQRNREAAEKEVKDFVAQHPVLVAVSANSAGRPGLPSGSVADLSGMLRDALQKDRELHTRYQVLTNQLATARADAVSINMAESKITQADADRMNKEKQYEGFQQSYEQSQIALAFGAKASNIVLIEQPTAPFRNNKEILKAVGGISGVFFLLAFGLPFFIELVLDQTFKHPMEVKARIGAPFFITIPKTNGGGKLAALKQGGNVPLLPANSSAKAGSAEAEASSLALAPNGQMARWDERQELRPFFDTLRDRLMTYFEMINLTHKPKLVAVTSCEEGAGVTTTAAGLASSLSETGDGNVLLVNMNVVDGETHHFYKGKLTCGIEQALGKEKRTDAQIHHNLFVAEEAEAGNNMPRVLPRRFSNLVPLMKASDYDYIIFDMPPISEISITPRLARFMDMVLLVIESKKTPREAAVRAASILEESKTHVGLVLNKNRSYLPKRLEQSI